MELLSTNAIHNCYHAFARLIGYIPGGLPSSKKKWTGRTVGAVVYKVLWIVATISSLGDYMLTVQPKDLKDLPDTVRIVYINWALLIYMGDFLFRIVAFWSYKHIARLEAFKIGGQWPIQSHTHDPSVPPTRSIRERQQVFRLTVIHGIVQILHAISGLFIAYWYRFPPTQYTVIPAELRPFLHFAVEFSTLVSPFFCYGIGVITALNIGDFLSLVTVNYIDCLQSFLEVTAAIATTNDGLMETKDYTLNESTRLKLIHRLQAERQCLRIAAEEFIKVRKAFNEFLEAFGIVFLLGVLIPVFASFNQLFAPLFWPSYAIPAQVLSQIFCAVYYCTGLLVLCLAGSYLNNLVRDCHDSIDAAVSSAQKRLDSETIASHYSSFARVNVINANLFDWNWNLSSCGMFQIRVAMLPSCLSSLMVYVIFLVQLRFAEIEVK